MIIDLPTLLKLINDKKKTSRINAENTTIQVSLATIYDLISYVEQKDKQEIELFKQKVRAAVR